MFAWEVWFCLLKNFPRYSLPELPGSTEHSLDSFFFLSHFLILYLCFLGLPPREKVSLTQGLLGGEPKTTSQSYSLHIPKVANPLPPWPFLLEYLHFSATILWEKGKECAGYFRGSSTETEKHGSQEATAVGSQTTEDFAMQCPLQDSGNLRWS